VHGAAPALASRARLQATVQGGHEKAATAKPPGIFAPSCSNHYTIFANDTVIICADHGDCWGEDGLWEHGVSHEKTLEVPLLFRLVASA
jgi:hypothetical protein